MDKLQLKTSKELVLINDIYPEGEGKPYKIELLSLGKNIIHKPITNIINYSIIIGAIGYADLDLSATPDDYFFYTCQDFVTINLPIHYYVTFIKEAKDCISYKARSRILVDLYEREEEAKVVKEITTIFHQNALSEFVNYY